VLQLSTYGFGTTLLCLVAFCKRVKEKVMNLVRQNDTCPSIIGTELIGGGKREKWNCGLITAKDEMKRVARDETLAIRHELPLAYCCNNGNGVGRKEWEKLKM
jgi:hypothetical protein